jgi:hypothetical protein
MLLLRITRKSEENAEIMCLEASESCLNGQILKEGELTERSLTFTFKLPLKMNIPFGSANRNACINAQKDMDKKLHKFINYL